MAAQYFSPEALAGRDDGYQRAVGDLKEAYGFDFVSMGLTESPGAPLRWVYSVGALGERHKRIALTPGRGIGGIVVKAGKPMRFDDIDAEIDPCEYSSYPIVFAEDLRSFCALPLVREGGVAGALLCAFRTSGPQHSDAYRRLIDGLAGRFCDCDVISDDFINFENFDRSVRLAGRPAASAERLTGNASHPDQERDAAIMTPSTRAASSASPSRCSEISHIIAAQEEERRRISRELHDGVAQEILMLSFDVRRIDALVEDPQAKELISGLVDRIDHILDEIHGVTVELRPSALDHLGLCAALRSQAAMFEKFYGPAIVFDDRLADTRFAPELETQAYRICQEAILNACKYSGSDRIEVTAEFVDGKLHMTVSDEGRGFDVEHPTVRGTGCGLVGMRERAGLIGADLSVVSSELGTTVTLDVPLDAGEGGCDD